ncbi:uncharacterized protein LOC129229971 [Uloborus diversus]|uniref:uncharacterized protein LOC129229971 n=1 Tax=Uloborus diversus TaxID=327109 RepID=UPI00240A2EF1|nr:uncharacterized protein LOC129229971 [Uloborus diversus]
MSFLRRCIKATENLNIVNNWHFLKYNRNAEFASFGSKAELPSPPKKPLTAYMIFCKETRKEILKDKPALSGIEQIKVLAEKWSHLSRENKEPYEVIARESTLAYGEAHKKFYENLTTEQKEELARVKAQKKESRRLLKLRKALKETGLPKPAGSAYNLFIRSQAKLKIDIKEPTKFIKEVAEVWKNLPEEKKKEFELQAQKDKERFALEMQNWKDKLAKENKLDLFKNFEEMRKRGKLSVDVALQDKKEVVSETKNRSVSKN